ncbi:MAG: putative MPP superfamily phosphohydrolase [Cyclobacteriaceae bacterium]|jgi:predicted MPP superfamily phosphohydrolase
MNRIYILIVAAIVYGLLDFYVYQAIKISISDFHESWRKGIVVGYISASFLLFMGFAFYTKLDPKAFENLRLFLATAFFITLVGKLFVALFLFIDDFRRFFTYLVSLLPAKTETEIDGSRSEFMVKASLVAGVLPIAALSFGVISGAHDYRVRKRTISFKSLPKAFDGIRIAQISDIHTGSFFSRTAVKGGVDMLMAEKPDMAFFTGDLVNNQSDEAKPYLDIFKKVQAPLGVYSTMGNHDYGDYKSWASPQAKQKDIQNIHEMHRYMGWDILLNEHRIIKESGDQLAILGLENWGNGRFSKYGDMSKTLEGVEAGQFKLLLSHDPSHWDAQVRPNYGDIDLTLAGHTHGMQFGIEFGEFRWSPSQYVYPRWADLYKEEDQYLYVNRGYGYLGYPGRVGILPEITILELKSV